MDELVRRDIIEYRRRVQRDLDDAIRRLAFAGIAVVWVVGGAPMLRGVAPGAGYVGALLSFVIALALDFAGVVACYFYGTRRVDALLQTPLATPWERKWHKWLVRYDGPNLGLFVPALVLAWMGAVAIVYGYVALSVAIVRSMCLP